MQDAAGHWGAQYRMAEAGTNDGVVVRQDSDHLIT